MAVQCWNGLNQLKFPTTVAISCFLGFRLLLPTQWMNHESMLMAFSISFCYILYEMKIIDELFLLDLLETLIDFLTSDSRYHNHIVGILPLRKFASLVSTQTIICFQRITFFLFIKNAPQTASILFRLD